MNTRKFLSMLAIASVLMYSCSDDDDNPVVVNEEEVITTMTVTLTNGTDVVTLVSRDLDGPDGPNAPVITVSGSLSANTTYAGEVELLNESETPAENVNEEIEEEADEHQFFFEAAGTLNATTMYTDTEADYPPNTGTNPVGITFDLTTTDASTGSFTVTLRHEPTKPNDGTLADAGGDTDIAQSFDLTIE
ncbi:type 1 periplasmic binding fold superfamily protein [Aquimarina sp. MMG015]|uniref:type 1 periplasmic binding fold superfamily protein n=1 Tax=unclassified Aquimarina TaxID=2627091 RepID=UPI000D5502A2|nr:MULTISPECIES: type 1 periplasmic binding fold superfamily protein [unclassified Aquimarina]MBQ4801560.1 type 1 periplasmic binding fold superfamily protein [Aquimarina sp. MMG015]